MRSSKRTVTTVESHTEGMPTRVVIDGVGEIPGASAFDKRRYFMEYVMLAGHNDSDEDADRLPALLAGLPAHLNLIAHNPFPGSPFLPSSPQTVLRFRDRLHGLGVRALIRVPRGQDIDAACGQLARRAL